MTDLMVNISDVRASYRDNVVLKKIDLSVPKGTCASIIGESGSGKSTLARVVMGMKTPDSGSVLIEGEDITHRKANAKTNGVELIFQDPISSLNPRRRLRDIVAEPLRIRGIGTPSERAQRADELLDRVGLPHERYAKLKPNSISGGQAQRVAIARALAAQPRLLICDEPVSALDVSIQAIVLNLFADLRDEGLTLIFISHDLAVVRAISDSIHVLRHGEIVESGEPESIIANPQHPYTKELIDAVPTLV